MKKEMNSGSAKRLIIIISLCLVALVAFGAFSFAWIRNYVDVDTLEIKSGKMLYNFKLYRVSDPTKPIVFFDTNNPKDALEAESADEGYQSGAKKIEREINNAIIDIEDGEEVFFVIEKYEDSIDFDVALTFNKDGIDDKSFENIGEMSFAMYDDSEAYNSNAAGYFSSLASNPNKGAVKNLGNIWTTIQETSVAGEQQYACVRLKLNKNAVDATFEDNSFPFRIGFCIAQKGALPDNDYTDRYYVDDVTSLEEAMQQYGVNDEIYITQSVKYTGDLVFTRPCTVTLIRSTLTVTGNVTFSYMYGGIFALNTVSDGHVVVQKNQGAGGHFRVDLPNTTLELVGANNDPTDTTDIRNIKGDIYIEGNFTANASTKDNEGLLLKGTRICNINTDNGTYTYASSLKPLLINGSTRLSVSNRTKLGELSANVYCRNIRIDNNGYIEKIDLREMTHDTTFKNSPSIYINNAGTFGDTLIVLPNWSKKFISSISADKSSDDNTHIIANKGSGEIRAITFENLEIAPEVINAGSSFFSTGKKGEDGFRDDIDYMLRTQFVEAVNGDKTNIIIHYEAPSSIILKENQYQDLASLTNLKSFIDYYATKGDIAPANELKKVAIICYGDKALTAPPLKKNSTTEYETGLEYDYNFIKSMTSVTHLDLSEATSTNKKVPDNAFKGMASLATIEMSESDTTWGKYLFTGTSVDEITFPQSLTTLDNPRRTTGNKDVTAQNSLDGIRYVHTSIHTVDGFYLSSTVKQYLFTPDQYTYDAYRALYNNVYWKSKIFLGEGVHRFGEYFIRYDPNTTEIAPTCEFVVFTGGLKSDGKLGKWVDDEYNNCGFDFQRIVINGTPYTITSYDAYALFEKLVCEENLEIVISDAVKYIGERAFACDDAVNTNIGLKSVVIEGNPEIMGYAFTYNDALVEFSAPELTTLKGGYNFARNNVLKTFYAPKLSVVEGGGDLSNCPELETVDICVIDRTDTNKDFYTSSESNSYAKFYIHTEYARDVSTYNDALAADYRHIFVKQSYAKLYRATSTYTGVTDMGENELSSLREADADGNDLVEGEQLAYYYVIDGGNAHLVACMLPEIAITNGDYTTIATFGNGAYPVTYIGSAAYHFTKMTAQNINISSGVNKLGNYVFDAKQKGFKKYCITLNLNDVTKAGEGAFYYMDMVRIVGDKLEEVSANTLSYNQNLIVANLPNLVRSRPMGNENTPPTVFTACNKLRIAYTSASDDISFDNRLSRQYSYVRFINGDNSSENFKTSGVNTIIKGSVTPQKKDFLNNYVNVDNAFSRIYLTDYYDLFVEVNGVSANINLPGYIFYKEDSGDLTIFAVSPDIKSFGDYGISGRDYTTPNYVYSDGNSGYTTKNNGTEALFNVTKIGKHSYGAVSITGLDTFNVANNITILDDYALSGSAYNLSSDTEIVMLKDVGTLNLTNVTEIGTRACDYSQIVTLNAPLLKKIGDYAFSDSSKLQTAYLPSYERAEGTNTFRYCVALTRITFGKNATNLVNNMFFQNTSLREIVILNNTTPVTISGNIINSATLAKDILIYVPAAVYSEYTSDFAGGFGSVPVDNINYFGGFTSDNDIIYYWNVIDELEKTVYVDYIEGLEGKAKTTITIPTTLDGYTVVSVSDAAMKALAGVERLVLPDNMQYLTFTAADIADSVTTFIISESNTKFKTDNGVLYSKDGKTLLVYPKNKLDKRFTVPDTVTEIAYRAFYGAKNLQNITISGVVTIRDNAFESLVSLTKITFTNATASTFEGRNIFLDANVNLQIFVPTASFDAYKAGVLVEYSIIEKFEKA